MFRPALQPTREAQERVAAALRTVAAWSVGKGCPWLLIVGPTGCGKSHLLKAALRESVLLKDTGYYMTAAQFDRNVKRFGLDEEDPDDYVEKIAHLSGPLIIDDLGAGYMDKSGYTATKFERLIDQRYEAESPTAFASNLGMDQFKAQFGERVVSRITDRRLSQVISLAGCSDMRGSTER